MNILHHSLFVTVVKEAFIGKAVEESAHLSKSDCRLSQSIFDRHEDLFNKTLGT